MRLPVDERNRTRGYGNVEFGDRESLIAALTKRDTTFNGRPIKITLDEPKQERFGGGGGRGAQQDGPLKSDEADWRRPQADAGQADSDANWSSGGRDHQQRSGGEKYMQRQNDHYQNRGGQNRDRGGGGGGGGAGFSNQRFQNQRGGGNWSGHRGHAQDLNEGQRRQYSSSIACHL